MVQSVLEMAKDLVSEQIKAGAVSPEHVSQLLQSTHQNLLSLKSIEESDSPLTIGSTQISDHPVNWKKSITKHAVTCLECGETFKQLSTRHLRLHDLDGRSYRAKYGIPRTQPLSAKSTTELRQKVAEQIRPWEKAPTFKKKAQATSRASVKVAKKTASSSASAKRKTRSRKSAARKS